MSLNDPLSNVLSHIKTQDNKGRDKVIVKPNSKTIRSVLNILNKNNYLGEIKSFEDKKGGYIEVSLVNTINNVGVIKPKHSVKIEDYEKYEKRYLPAMGFGFLIISTNNGIMTHNEAIKKGLGGKLLAFVY